MYNKRIAAKRDGNEQELVRYLEALGFVVERDLPTDLIVVRNGKLVVGEVKNGRGRLTPREADFIARCADQGVDIPIWRDLDDILRDFGMAA